MLAGLLVTGSIAATRGVAVRFVALAWAVGGIDVLVSDWVVNREDVLFHAVLTVVMVGLASAGWFAAVRLGGGRGRRTLAA